MLLSLILFFAGLLLLYYGAEYLIEGSSRLAVSFGVRPLIIGMTIVALGTSLPELAASIMAQVKNESDISIGNVIGSNLFNMFFVGGGAASVKGLEINTAIYNFEVPFMMLFTLLLFPIIFVSKGIKRPQAIALLVLYVLFIAVSYIWR